MGIQAEPQPGIGMSLSLAVSSLDDVPEFLVTTIGLELGCQARGPPKTEETKDPATVYKLAERTALPAPPPQMLLLGLAFVIILHDFRGLPLFQLHVGVDDDTGTPAIL